MELEEPVLRAPRFQSRLLAVIDLDRGVLKEISKNHFRGYHGSYMPSTETTFAPFVKKNFLYLVDYSAVIIVTLFKESMKMPFPLPHPV